MGNDKAPTLTEFLLARIAEREAVARAATYGPWRYNPAKVNAIDRSESVFAGKPGTMAITVASTGPSDDPQSMSDAAHIALHDPARILAECAAKRAVIKAAWSDHCLIEGEWGGGQSQGAMSAKNDNPAVVEALASVYADHPDFQEEWRP